MDRNDAGTESPFSARAPRASSPDRRLVLRLRAPAQQMLQRRGGRSGRVPGHEAGRTGSARRGSSGRTGEVPGRAGGIRAPAIRTAGYRGSHASKAQPWALRPRPLAHPPHLVNGRPPSDPPAPAGRKVTSAGPGARARGGVGTGSAHVLRAVRRRRGEEAADSGCSPRLPAPLCRRLEAQRSCGGGTRPETAQRKPASS